MKDQDKYLRKQSGRKTWLYTRGVPTDLHEIDKRAPIITKSTRTQSLLEAREIRDKWVVADDSFWEALRGGMDAKTAREKYDAAVAIQKSRGGRSLKAQTLGEIVSDPEQAALASRAFANATRDVVGLPSADIPTEPSQDATDDEWQLWLDSIRKIRGRRSQRQSEAIQTIISAGLGLLPAPAMNLKEAYALWKELKRSEWAHKKGQQLAIWENLNRLVVNLWLDIIGKEAVFLDTTNEQVRRFYDAINDKVKLPASEGGIKPSTANKYLSHLRKWWRDIARHHGADIERTNPFEAISWSEPKRKRSGKAKGKRPAFTVEGLKDILEYQGLQGMNAQARHILLVLVETGMRLSEICNIQPENILLDDNIPHLYVTETEGADIKNDHSDRHIPLVGIALEVMRLNPQGFPAYFQKSNNASATILKFLRGHALCDPPTASIHSIRHAFEGRMKAAGLDHEMRMELMGHTDERPDYGEGFHLEAKQRALLPMALPFDATLLAPENT